MSILYRVLLAFGLSALYVLPGSAAIWEIKPGSELSEIKKAVALAQDFDTLYIHHGEYVENLIEINKPLSIIGVDNPVIDSPDGEEIFVITADDVLVRGLVLKNVTVSYIKDRAAIKLVEVKGAVIEGNQLYNNFFGVYFQKSSDCIVRDNLIKGDKVEEFRAGNAIHVWYGQRIQIINNQVIQHRDGIYLEFVDESLISDNLSRGNNRYGLHFMFSNFNIYKANTFEENDAGVAVMFSKNIRMLDNRFAENWGGSSYGILLKEISDGLMTGNTFEKNTVGIYAEGANRIKIENNQFLFNGKAMEIQGNCTDNEVINNNFIGNTFEVLTNSRASLNHFEGNYWAQYKGYDLDKNGFGDVPHRPVNLFAMVTDRIPAANMLLHSFLVNGLEMAERLFPQMIPEHLIDEKPRIKPIEYD